LILNLKVAMHLKISRFTKFSTFKQYNEDSDDEEEDADKTAAQPESLEVCMVHIRLLIEA
jgi:hypothetical protein